MFFSRPCSAVMCTFVVFVLKHAEGYSGNVSQWYLGCYNWSSLGFANSLHQTPTGQGADPAECSKLCLDEGYLIAALSGEQCYCGDQAEGSLISENSNSPDTVGGESDMIRGKNSTGCTDLALEPDGYLRSSTPQSSHSLQCSSRCFRSMCLPYGDATGRLAVYRSRGPYVHSFTLSAVAERVQIGKPFLLEVSGCLAASQWQLTGIQGLRAENLSWVDIEFSWSLGDQRSCKVAVQDNGHFTLSKDWTLTISGSHHLNVTVSNSISKHSTSLQITPQLPSPEALEVTLIQEFKDIPSCVPFSVQESQALQKVFLGDTSTFRAYASTGVSLNFSWNFTDNEHFQTLKENCQFLSDCLTSTVNYTFRKEGIHAVTVNASNVYGWTSTTIHVAVVRRVLSNLTLLSHSGFWLAVGQITSLELELFTTMRQLLFLNTTLRPGVVHTLSLADNPKALQSTSHLRLLDTYGLHSCLLHLRLLHRFASVGRFVVSVSVSDLNAEVLSAALPHPFQVYEPIQGLWPALPWRSVIPSHEEITFNVISRANLSGSVLLWTVARGNITVVNQTAEDLSLSLSLPDAGNYFMSIKAFNPISSSSFHTHLQVQDAISGLTLVFLSLPHSQTGSVVSVKASVSTGTNVTYIWSFGSNSSLITGSGIASHVFSQPGVFTVMVKAENNISQAMSNILEFIIQDPVGDIVLHVPNIITVGHQTTVSFAVMMGTNIAVAVFANDTAKYRNNTYVVGNYVTLFWVFEQTGIFEITVQAHNNVSTKNKTLSACSLRELHKVIINVSQPPIVGESTILTAEVNGFLLSGKNYLYSWSIPSHNQSICTGTPVVSIRWEVAGAHSVNVTVSDQASVISAGVLLNVTEPTGATLLSHPAIAAVGTLVHFSLKNASPGSTLDIDLGSGDKTTLVLSFAEYCVSFSHTYSQSGLYSIRVASGGVEMLSSLIDIQEPVHGIHIMGPDTHILPISQPTPPVLTWTAEVSQGTNYIYRWSFSDGREEVKSIGPDRLTMAVEGPGQLRVELSVENEVSRLTASLLTLVQFGIDSVSLTVAHAAPGQPSNMVLTVMPQQDYCITVDFGDGHRVAFSSRDEPPQANCSSVLTCPSVFAISHIYASAGVFNFSALVSSKLSVFTKVAEIVIQEAIRGILLVLNTSPVIRLSGFIKATASVQTGSVLNFRWHVALPDYTTHSHSDRNTSASSLNYQVHIPGTYNVSVMVSSPLESGSLAEHLQVKVRGPIGHIQVQLPFGRDHAALLLQPDGLYSTGLLKFSAHSFSKEVNFTYHFGIGTPISHVEGVTHQLGAIASSNHQFSEEGTFLICISAYNEFYNATKVQHPFYVQKMPTGLQLTMNSSLVHKNEVVLFKALLEDGTNVTYTWSMGDQTTYVDKGPVVSHRFLTAAVYTVSVTAQNRVGSMSDSTRVSVLHRMQSVRIYMDEQAYATETDITFLAVTEEPGLLEFQWHFGDRPAMRTTSRTITKRYYTPDRYNVIVNASNGLSSSTSDIYPVVIQRAVRPNRLLFSASVLVNTTADFRCRINAGTNVSYLWNFGDGTERTGGSTEQHMFNRTGEFTVEVTVSNLVSSAFLRGHLFVVSAPCLPPPVKNMGPNNIQVRRYQTVRLGVTYEADIQCNISQGLRYSWALYESSGLPVLLPLIETHSQNIDLPNRFLHYGTYSAIARVQIVGSVVYSNYTVGIEVVPSPPVSHIYGGTNIFISRHNSTTLTLDGQRSHDPDYPQNPMSYNWHCKPVSTIESSCFDEYVPTSSPVVTFPASFLKSDFDQFKFTLTVQSGDRSSSSEMFVTITSNLVRKVSVYCDQCQGSSVNWNEQFTVIALCENCGGVPSTFYSWELYMVNASSKVAVEDPFCSSVDLGVASNMADGPVFVQPPEVTPPVTAVPLDHSVPPLVSFGPSTLNVQTTTVPVVNETLHWPTNKPESQTANFIPLKTTSSAGMHFTTTAVSEPTTTPLYPLFPPFSLPFPEEGELSGGRPHKERSPEPLGDETPTNSSPVADPASEVGLLPPTSSEFDFPWPPFYISEFPVSSEDGSNIYSGPVSESDIIAEFPIGSEFPFIFEGGDVGGRLDALLSGDSFSEGIIGPFPGPAPYFPEEGVYPGPSETTLDSQFNFTDYDYLYIGIEEAEPGVSEGRPTGVGSVNSNVGEGVLSGYNDNEGSNLVDSSSPARVAAESTLLDLEREHVDPAVFQSYTLTGISSSIIMFKPFMLNARSLYMLEVSAISQQTLLGKTQLFFSTHEVPQRMTCQVQPSKGFEIHTEFSIFCTSGKEDLLYEFSFTIGNTPRQILYKGRDFQRYFNLPSGDPENDYKLTIYTEVRNGFGAATKPCPVTVKVLPSFQRNVSSFYNPEQELFIYGVGNLTHLIQKGDGREIRNYIILLTNVLNRLSQDPTSSKELLTDIRSALISAGCQQTISVRGSTIDNMYILKDLMKVTGQVTFNSAKLVTKHIRDISSLFHANVPVNYPLDEWLVNTLVSLLSYALEAPVSSSEGGIQLTYDGIRTTTDLLLKYVLFNKVPQHSVSTSLMELKTWQYGSPENTVSSVGSTTFYLPDVLDLHISGHTTDSRNSCVITQLTFFKQELYFWGRAAVQLDRGVADMRLYNCTTRGELKVRSLSTPINIEFQKRPKQGSNASDFTLLRSQVNIHQFNVTPENLQQALQITVEFTQPANYTFPIMLLVRMFERPTPSLYIVQKVHRWEGEAVHIFLPPSSLNGAGTVYLTLLNADYSRSPRNKYIASSVNYTLYIESTQCLSWDGVREWRPDGCTPLAGLSSTRVNCSCSHLTTFAMAYQEIQSHHDFADVSQYISLHNNLTLCSVVVISLAVFVLVLILCKHADVYDGNKGSHLVPDNSPSDQHLYTLTIDTGFRSRSSMTAKVHIVLHGEDGVSQTRELNISDSQLFSRNSRSTFILSTAESLGPIWMLHLWHDNRGPSPSWYVSHVVVKDVGSGTSWFFLGECWLAVDEGDGRVERKLVASKSGLGFRKLLYLKLTEYLEDFHLWVSVYSRPSHSTFSRTQRLGVCLLLLQGYMCVNTVLIYLLEDQYSTELGLIDVSAVSLVTGIVTTLTALPVGSLVSLLFRLSKANGSENSSGDQYKVGVPGVYSVEAHHDALLQSRLDWQAPSVVSGPCNKLTDSKEVQGTSDSSSSGFEDGFPNDNSKTRAKQSQYDLQSSCSTEKSCQLEHQSFGSVTTLPPWYQYVAWALCLSLCLACITVTGVLGIQFNTSKSLLWIHSLFFSLLFCVFVVHPALIIVIAVVVSLWYRRRDDFCNVSNDNESVVELLKHWRQNGDCCSENDLPSPYHQPQGRYTHFDRVLAARQRARYLRLVRPPTPGELKGVRSQIRRKTLIHKTLREMMLYIIMLSLLLLVTYGKSSNNKYHLNQAIRAQFTRSPHNSFQAIANHEDWWNWTLTTMLDGLYWDTWYNNASAKNKAGAVQGTCTLIGEPILKKIEVSNNTVCRVPRLFGAKVPDCLWNEDAGLQVSAAAVAISGSHGQCGQLGCYEGPGISVRLGNIRSVASDTLRTLRARGWMGTHTRAVMAQFTLYNPPSNLFTTVSMLVEQPPSGSLLPSAFIESTRVYRTASALDYVIMTGELLFLLLTLLQLYFQICTMSQKGLLVYCQYTWNWLEMTIITISLLYYIYNAYHFILTLGMIDHLLREDFKTFVDLSFISSWEQLTRSLHSVIVFLLLMKCIFVLRMNKAMVLSVAALKLSFSNLLWPLVAGVILMMAFSCLGSLLFHPSSYAFSSLTRSLQTVITYCRGIGQLKTLSELYRLNRVSIALYYGSFFFIVSIAWTAVIIAVLTSLARMTKKTSRRKYLLTFIELATYITDTVSVFIGQRRQRWIDNQAHRNNFYLEEFEDLVDELLFKLNAFSNSLHHTLPITEQGEGENESPFISLSEHTYSFDSEYTVVNEDHVRKTTRKTEIIFSDDADNLFLSSPEESHLGSKLELERFQYLQPDQRTNQESNLSESFGVSSSLIKGPEKKSEDPNKSQTVESSDQTNTSPKECSGSLKSPDHHNMVWTRDDLTDFLSETRCTKKQVGRSRALSSPMSHLSNPQSAKNSVLRRSHAFQVVPFESPETDCEVDMTNIPGVIRHCW